MGIEQDLVGQRIEHYDIKAIIGLGGMGAVFQAEDMNLARPVAVKVLNPHFAQEEAFQQRFQQEAQAAARLDHPSIVRVYHFGREHGLLYLVMELVPGLSLGAYMNRLAQRRQTIRLDETVLLVSQVADALGYAHRKGVIHRDIKPDNVIVKQIDQAEYPGEPPLRAVVTDFGLAKLLEGGVHTRSGEFLGTLAYVSPEQMMDQPVDGRSDIYSLGVVLYQLASGQLPFDVHTPSEALEKHLQERPPLPSHVQPAVPPVLENVIMRALAKEPSERFQTGDEFAAALRQAASQLDQVLTGAAVESLSEDTASMVNELDQDPNLAHTSRWNREEMVPPPGYDRLLIRRQGEEPEIYSLYKNNFTIGRSETNDIVLVGSRVSRRHARLKYKDGNWAIIDVGSTNGTFIEDHKLHQGTPQVWPASQAARIGPFLLQLAPPALDLGPEPDLAGESAKVTPAPAEPANSIDVDLRPQTVKDQGICRVLIVNRGRQPATITVSAADMSGRIQFDAAQKQVALGPGQKGIVDFFVSSKRRPFFGLRQLYPFQVSAGDSRQTRQTLEGQLSVKPAVAAWWLFLLLVACAFFVLLVWMGLNALDISPTRLFDLL